MEDALWRPFVNNGEAFTGRECAKICGTGSWLTKMLKSRIITNSFRVTAFLIQTKFYLITFFNDYGKLSLKS